MSITSLAVVIGTAGLMADPDDSRRNPFEGETVFRNSSSTDQASFGSGLAGSIFNQKRANPGKIGPVQTDNDGRGEKATESKNTASNGSGVAYALGGTMIGIGAPMIPSVIPSVSAAGVELVTKGIMELVQGAVSNQAAQNNRRSEDMLRRDADPLQPLSTNEAAEQPAREKLLTPEMRGLLESKGTDPEKFADAMFANKGASVTEQNVARALGISPEVLTAGKSEEAKALVADEISRVASSVLTSDEGASTIIAAVSGGRDGLSESPREIPGSSVVGLRSDNFEIVNKGVVASKLTDDTNRFLTNLLGINSETARASAKQELMSAGILTLRKNRNIFQVARGEYHSFRRWRQSR